MTGMEAAEGGMDGAAEARSTPRAADVSALRPREVMQFDQARLVAVCDLHGTGAEIYIARVLGAIEAGVAVARAQADDPAALARTCEEIADAAREIGMVTMEQAARALRGCLHDGTGGSPGGETARHACLQRLLRLGRSGGTGRWIMSHESGPDTVA